MPAPRTVVDMMLDLHRFAQEREWNDRIVLGDCDEFACEDCGSFLRFDTKRTKAGEHVTGCEREALLKETAAFLRAEGVDT